MILTLILTCLILVYSCIGAAIHERVLKMNLYGDKCASYFCECVLFGQEDMLHAIFYTVPYVARHLSCYHVYGK